MEAHKEFLERIWSCIGNKILSAKREERVVKWWVNPAFIAVYLRGISKSINVIKKERRSWQEEHSRKKQGHSSQKQFTLPVTGYISFVLLLLFQGLGLSWKFPTPALSWHITCQNPQRSEYISECLKTLNFRCFKKTNKNIILLYCL